MAKIFISYRRADSQANTDRIYERLVRVFGKDAIFKDVDDIPLGEDFPRHLSTMIESSKVVLVIMGRTWATIGDNEGHPRINNPNDFVRVEVESALTLPDARVIPVLVNNATMPTAQQLPPSLQGILRLNAIEVRNDPDFTHDIERLIRNLQKLGIQAKRSPVGMGAGIVVAILIVVAVIFGAINLLGGTGTTKTPEVIVAENTEEVRDTATDTPTNTETDAPTDTATNTATSTATDTPTETTAPTNTSTATNTPTATSRPSDTATAIPTPIGGSGQLLYRYGKEDEGDIFLLDLEDMRETSLTNDPSDDSHPRWSFDGLQIAFMSNRTENSVYQIYVMNADGSNKKQITDTIAYSWHPTWSPDGSQIAFAESPNADENFEIYIMNADGSNRRQLTDADIESNNFTPNWSPNGLYIAFEGYPPDKNRELFIMNADGTNVQNLTNNNAVDWALNWSPDSSSIVFESDRDGNFEIYIMDIATGETLRLTDNSYDDWFPAWSPDGTQIAFTSNRDGNFEIYIMDTDGSNVRRITNTEEDEFDPQWRPVSP